MGGEQAAGVLATITQEQRKREGKEWTQEEEDALKKPIIARSLQSPFFKSLFKRNWDVMSNTFACLFRDDPGDHFGCFFEHCSNGL